MLQVKTAFDNLKIVFAEQERGLVIESKTTDNLQRADMQGLRGPANAAATSYCECGSLQSKVDSASTTIPRENTAQV